MINQFIKLLPGAALAVVGFTGMAAAQQSGLCGQPLALTQDSYSLSGPDASPIDAAVTIMRGEPAYFELQVGAATGVTVETSSQQDDPILILFDSNGTVIRADDDGTGTLNSLLGAELAAGGYCVQVRTLTDIPRGGGPLPQGFNTSIPFQIRTGVDAGSAGCMSNPQLVHLDQAFAPGFEAQELRGLTPGAYLFTLAETTSLSLSARSSEIDTVMTLEDANGSTIMTDDDGGGGTELLKAMKRATKLPKQEGVSRTMIVITDGYINAEREVFELIQQNLAHTNVFAFGIGSSVNRYLIEGMAKSGQGEPFIVTQAHEAQSAAVKFINYISSPVLTDIEVRFEGLDVYDLEPPAQPDLFAERPVIVFGKWKGEPKGEVTVSGKNGEGMYKSRIQFDSAVYKDGNGALNYLWARTRIARISDFKTRKGNSEKREEIVALGLKYNLLTPFTSFVAVDEIVKNPTLGSKDVKQPLTLPQHVSNLAVGGGVNRVPEPGLLLLAAMLLFSMIFTRLCSKKG